MTFRVTDERGRTLAEGKDLAALKKRLQPDVRAALSAAATGLERTGLKAWDIGDLPRTVRRETGGYALTAYPALVDEGGTVGVRLFETEGQQQHATWAGTRRLLLLSVASPVNLVNARLSNVDKLALSRNPHRSAADLLDDCLACAVDHLVAGAGGPAWDAAGFERLRQHVRAGLADALFDVVVRVRGVLTVAYDVEQRLATAPEPARSDLRAQFDGLVFRGFVTATGWQRLADLPRYLRAMQRRLDKLRENPARDLDLTRQVQQVQREYEQVRADVPGGDGIGEVRWMIEELRVNYFAQALGTPYPVSDKRIYRALDAIESAPR
jgi:ATP-dependent helicase HrpA